MRLDISSGNSGATYFNIRLEKTNKMFTSIMLQHRERLCPHNFELAFYPAHLLRSIGTVLRYGARPMPAGIELKALSNSPAAMRGGRTISHHSTARACRSMYWNRFTPASNLQTLAEDWNPPADGGAIAFGQVHQRSHPREKTWQESSRHRSWSQEPESKYRSAEAILAGCVSLVVRFCNTREVLNGMKIGRCELKYQSGVRAVDAWARLSRRQKLEGGLLTLLLPPFPAQKFQSQVVWCRTMIGLINKEYREK